MRIRGKLACSFLIIIILPTLLLLGTVGCWYQMQMQAGIGMQGEWIEVPAILSNPMQFVSRMTERAYEELEKTADLQPEQMQQQKTLDEYNEVLQWKYSYLVVKKGTGYSYIGDPESFEVLKERIPTETEFQALDQSAVYVGGENSFMIKEHRFLFEDGEVGYFYILTDINDLIPAVRSILIQFVWSFLIIMLITALILILWIYGGIVRPLNVLRNATHHMRDGDLDYAVNTNSKDEVGMLCRDFEQMRLRLKESTEMRLKYEQEMRELISNISHDLKTPLTAIEGYTEGILDGVASTPEKQEKYLRTIYAKARQMSKLVDELSTSAKIENGIVPYNFQHISVRDYFDDCVEEISVDLGLQNIQIVYDNQVEAQVRVEMDPEQLKRVINNIVGNAVKYLGGNEGMLYFTIQKVEQKQPPESDKKGQKKEKKKNKQDRWKSQRAEEDSQFQQEKTEVLREEIQVEFRDTGSGIAADALPHIFERCYRADSSRQSSTGGSGLGLAIAAKIIEDHGGRIWAESTEGEGTSIFFTLCTVEGRTDTDEQNIDY